MSILVSTQVWKLSRLSGNELLLLLAIADFADDNGRAYPSVATLARKCRIQLRGAQRILSVLRESGEIEVRMNGGPKGCNEYKIKLQATAHTDAPLHDRAPLHDDAPMHSGAPLHDDARGGAQPCAKPLHGGAPEPSLNRQEPSGPAVRSKRSADDALPDWLPVDLWKDFLDLRKKLRKPMTPKSIELNIKLLGELREQGHEPQAVIEQSIRESWQGLFPIRQVRVQSGAARADPMAPTETFATLD